MKRRKILSGCFAVSLSLHLLALVFLQRYSLWFSSPQKSEETSGYLCLVDKKERDQILKVAFEPITEEKEEKVSHKPQAENTSISVHSTIKIAEQTPPFLLSSPSFPLNEFLVSTPVLPKFSIPSESFNLLDHLPKDLIIPVPAQPTAHQFHPRIADSPIAMKSKMPSIQLETPPIPYSGSVEAPLAEMPQIAKTHGAIPLPSLPNLPTLDELETASYSDSFDADLVFLPREEGRGYIFALTLIPRPDLELPRFSQAITFLIDRSNSIQQGRLTATKAAVHKTLAELSPDDTFNIIAFDSKIDKMSPHFLPCTLKSFAQAEEFLEKIQLGSFFSSSDLTKSLLPTVPGQVNGDDLHTAILLTDGESLAKKNAPRSLLQNWTQFNDGKVALFPIGVNGDNHMPLLDVAASFNRGKLISAPTNRSLKRKLLKLVKTIQNPVAKNLHCKAISRSPQTKVRLFPKSSQLPHLYLDQPYVILGEADTLDDFILFVQGRLKDRWLNIKKTISFLSARKGTKSLKQEWALQQAYTLYEQYVLDENPKHIADAKDLLEPFDFQVAFR